MTGFQVLAKAGPVTPAVQPFPPADVQLLAGPFKEAMERNAAYLLSLEPDRLLHNTRKYCGLEPKAAIYGGWESLGIAGHTLGHYLTAISRQYAATGDKRFRERVDYLVGEMAECQKRYGDGYVGALPPRELESLRDLRHGKVDFKNAWVPWYTQHKVLAGLKDAWVLAGSQQAKEVTLKLADWVDAVTSGLTPEQQELMLRIEFGGMNEVMLELYGLTGNTRYLEISRRFYHHAVMDALQAGRDELPGKHANTQIPKVIGEARRYELTGDEGSRKIARYFWDTVVGKYTFALGGNSDREHFFRRGTASDHLGPQTAESCNTYNMLKLTEHLFCWEPRGSYADFYERALYNHIGASQEPRHGMFTYFISLKPGHFRTYSDPTNSFWCCVGTGMENHTKYGEAIYFHGADDLYVNLFIPSEVNWKARGLVLEQRTDLPLPAGGAMAQGPEDVLRTELIIKSGPSVPLALKVRCPAWTSGPVTFTLNGQPLPVERGADGFASLRRVWAHGDRLAVAMPVGLRLEPLEGPGSRVAFFYGPILLAGDLGRVPDSAHYPSAGDHRVNDHAPTKGVPVLVADDAMSLLKGIHPVKGEPLAFRTEGIGRPDDVVLRPFNRIPYDYYNVYWETLTADAWMKRKGAMAAAAAAARVTEARIVDELRPGEQQSEVDHAMTGERSEAGVFRDRHWRDARNGGFFSFKLKVATNVAQVLHCTYWGDEQGARTFDILANDKIIGTETLQRNHKGQFFEVDYEIPGDILAGHDTITVRFQARKDNFAGGLFGCSVLKKP